MNLWQTDLVIRVSRVSGCYRIKTACEQYFESLCSHILNFIADNRSPEFAKHVEGYDRFPAKNRGHGEMGLYSALVVGTEGVMEKGEEPFRQSVSYSVPQEEVTYAVYEMGKEGTR